ncbi:hypothetical protein AB0M29_34990 [Streptomyces sp. NPDC051976]|uniref:hypothetical protein n=1 Tax=Streptomyces sp. NPDC051976 TaxID=3154947 RepID=UPI00342468A6
MYELIEDAEPAGRLPRPDRIVLDGWLHPGRQRITLRLNGIERHGIILVSYTYETRRAHRISVRAEKGLPRQVGRRWWTDTSMR